MMKSRRLLSSAYIVAFIIISVIAIMEYTRYNSSRKNIEVLVSTQHILYQSEKVLTNLKDIEIGTRGFVITGEQEFLEPYYLSKDVIQPAIATLEKLAENDSAQHASMTGLSRLAAHKLSMSDSIQQLKKADPQDIERIKPLLLKGKMIMDSIRLVISNFQAGENRLLADREKENDASMNNNELGFFLLMGSGFILLVLLLLTVRFFVVMKRDEASVIADINEPLNFFDNRFEDVVRNLPDPFFVLDKNYTINLHNRAFKNSIAKGIDTRIKGKNFFETFPRYKETPAGNTIKTAMETSDIITFDTYDVWMDQWQCITVYPVAGGVAVSIRDENERMQKQQELDKTHKFLEEITAVSYVGGWEVNVADSSVMWSPITRQIHETPETFIPDLKTGIRYYKEGYSRDTIIELVNASIESGVPWDAELQIITAKGNEKWVRTRGRPEMENGECVKLVGTFQDITDKKVVEQKLTEERKLLKTLVDSLPLNIYMKDLRSKKTLVNQYEVAYMGAKDESELLGKDDFQLYPYEYAAISAEEDREIIATGKPMLNKETMSVKSDGTETWFLTSKIAFTNDEGEVTGIIGFSYDITARKHLQALNKKTD